MNCPLECGPLQLTVESLLIQNNCLASKSSSWLAGAKAPRYFLSNLSESVFIETRDARDKVSMLQYQLSNKKGEFLPLIDTETENDSLTDMMMDNDPAEMNWMSFFQDLDGRGWDRFTYR